MKLTVFNGSPRGKKSSSSLISSWMLEGIPQRSDIIIENLYLSLPGDRETAAGKLAGSDISLVIFPLYTDCMPGIVMAFFETLEPLRGALAGKKLGFVIHSGFPEACHSRCLEKYLVWLANELKADYMGTVVMGGSEGFLSLPPSKTAKKRELFGQLGRSMVENGVFDAEITKQMAGFEKLPPKVLRIIKIISRLGIMDIGWNRQLKANGAFDRRFARPYEQGENS